MQLTDLRP